MTRKVKRYHHDPVRDRADRFAWDDEGLSMLEVEPRSTPEPAPVAGADSVAPEPGKQ